ncbi:MAG: hypothetical protein JZU50_13085 [Desulfobulbaceae bacterium]|jgi:hypothetical protein|nr:hypothetical protein [Desulfobulbaceae bacterium]
MQELAAALRDFLETWEDTPEQNKQGFIRLKELLSGKEGLNLEFFPRPGLTYSLRASSPGNTRPLLVMIDVIEDQPRWLSICFYGDMVQDPEEKGALVPGGLLGEDALCFDLDTCSEEDLGYVEARIEEAYQTAMGG